MISVARSERLDCCPAASESVDGEFVEVARRSMDFGFIVGISGPEAMPGRVYAFASAGLRMMSERASTPAGARQE